MHRAAELQKKQAWDLLINYGADQDWRDNKGNKPEDYWPNGSPPLSNQHKQDNTTLTM